MYGVFAAILFAGALVGTESPQESVDTSAVEQQSPTSEAEPNPQEDLTDVEKAEQALEIFVPTEEVPADSAVSFPVDI